MKKDYRLYAIHMLPNLRTLDFNRITQKVISIFILNIDFSIDLFRNVKQHVKFINQNPVKKRRKNQRELRHLYPVKDYLNNNNKHLE